MSRHRPFNEPGNRNDRNLEFDEEKPCDRQKPDVLQKNDHTPGDV
jgi:hypothetical protein